MLSFLIIAVLHLSLGIPVFAGEKYDENSLYECRPLEGPWIEVSVHRRIHGIGPQKFVGVIQYQEQDGKFLQRVVRLNLTSYYEGRIVFFTSSDLRLRFDRTQVQEYKMQSFTQIPWLKVYTDQWTCKGPSFLEIPDLSKNDL